MRTTLAIDDDVLAAAKELASSQRISIGQVISSLVRRALQPAPTDRATRNGIPLLSVRRESSTVSSELVVQLQNDLL